MTNPSNLYAERVFAEHPIALWSLDDKLDYLSLIDEADRDMSTWSISGGTLEELDVPVSKPFPDSYGIKITGDTPTTTTAELSITSNDTFNFSDLNQTLGTFSLGAWIYANNRNLESITIGYSYNSGSTVELKKFLVEASENWVFVSETFNIPDVDDNAKIIIKIRYFLGESNPEEYEFYVNGISAGQWSEEFAAVSLGIDKSAFPNDIAIDASYSVPAKVYGLQDLDGHYLIKNETQLLARNTGVPLVYGASNVTTLYATDDGSPSLIVPGQGFLNANGQSSSYTAEMWLRINGGTNETRRIFGPIASTDGIYVQGPYLILKIGNNSEHHFVGKWYRPMLIQILLSNNNAGLVVNGEQVISMQLSSTDLAFPDKLDESGKDQDWLGFYVYDKLDPLEVDCVSIFPYTVPLVLCKRRWVYGQAVSTIESINKTFDGNTATIDYQFAEYSNSYSYPDIGRWDQGTLDNVEAERSYIRTPQYSLPEIKITETINEEQVASTKTYDNLISANSEIQDSDLFITMFPNEDWGLTSSYLYLPSFSLATSQAKYIYGIFSEPSLEVEDQTLIYIKDKRSSSYLDIRIKDGNIEYAFKYGSEDEEILFDIERPDAETKFAVGIDIKSVTSAFGGNVAKFFGSINSLEVYIANSKDLSTPFYGNIYKIGLSTSRNGSDMTCFDEVGLISAIDFVVEDLSDHVASYLLRPIRLFDEFKLDIAANSYWEDYVPLTYFAKYAKDISGLDTYTLDMIQFNVNYPSPAFLTDGELTTSNSAVKTYISFQTLSSGANRNFKNIANTVNISASKVIKPDTNWADTKYEVVDGAIIYPPPITAIESLAIVIHVDINVGATIEKPILIKTLQLASQSYNASSATKVGTRFGVPVYPYKKSGLYFDYKSPNPISIYKDTTPYLYLTRDSGISIIGDFDPRVERGVSIPINASRVSDYKIATIQSFIRFDGDAFPSTPTQIFEIESKNLYIKFYMVSTDPENKRAKIFAVNAKTGRIEEDLIMYWNGTLVVNPVISLKQWGVVGIGFGSQLDFSNYQGAIRLNGPLTFNHISYHTLSALQEIQQVAKRSWLRVRYTGENENDWEFWAENYNWSQVLILNTSRFYGANPIEMFKAYTGSNKFIFDDDSLLVTKTYEYNTYTNVQIDTYTLPAA